MKVLKPGINTILSGQYLKYYMLGILISADFGGNEDSPIKINDLEYYDALGLNILVFSNWYDGNFSDSKISGIEIIQHGIRSVTNGDVRLNPTPEQWDPIPKFEERQVDRMSNIIEARLYYPDSDFRHMIRTVIENNGLMISIIFDKPLPEDLAGKEGFNLEFLPSVYFEKTYKRWKKRNFSPLSGRAFDEDRREQDGTFAHRLGKNTDTCT